MIRQSGVDLPAPTRIEAFAGQLILRWGVLIRDLLARETNAPFWRDLLPVLRRKEAQGELRGGRFAAGFSGEQFAAPEALDLLRAVRRAGDHPEDQVQIANADPFESFRNRAAGTAREQSRVWHAAVECGFAGGYRTGEVMMEIILSNWS